jgi:transcriptional regulator with XRE-family HTH domain
MKLFKPIPSNLVLAPTLARRIVQVREFRNMTARDLAELSHFSINRVEELEAGLETWLSSTDRQRLAKALSLEPNLLKEVEVRAKETAPIPESKMLDAVTAERLAQDILDGVENLRCPDCGAPLKTNVIDGLDMDGFPTQFAKAFCVKCPYVLRI